MKTIAKEQLEKYYLKDNLSIKKIGKVCECNPKQILRLLKINNIPIRLKPKSKFNITKEQLEKYYLEDKLSIKKISEIYGCSFRWIQRLLKKRYNIPMRLRGNVKGTSRNRFTLDKITLEKHYLQEHLTAGQIGKLYDRSATWVFELLKKFKILSRHSYYIYKKYSKEDKKHWVSLESIIVYLKSIAVDGYAPRHTEMTNIYGKLFYPNIKKYGGYKNVLKLAGLKLKKHLTATDGHIFISYYELLFDEYLYLNNIQHETDGLICDVSNYRYDFKIDDIFIEIWGFTKSGKFGEIYKRRRIKKEKLYNKNKLKLISFEREDFKKSSEELQTLFKSKLLEFGIKSNDSQMAYPIFNRRKFDYWCERTVIEELKKYVDKNGIFPTFNQLMIDKRSDLAGAIKNFGGYRKFAVLLGFEPKTKKFSEEYVVNELKKIKKLIGHFPNQKELREMKRDNIASMISLHNGYGYYQQLINGTRNKRPFGYWNNENNILIELQSLTNQLGRFPKYAELGQVARGVDKSKKGMDYFKNKIKL